MPEPTLIPELRLIQISPIDSQHVNFFLPLLDLPFAVSPDNFRFVTAVSVPANEAVPPAAIELVYSFDGDFDAPANMPMTVNLPVYAFQDNLTPFIQSVKVVDRNAKEKKGDLSNIGIVHDEEYPDSGGEIVPGQIRPLVIQSASNNNCFFVVALVLLANQNLFHRAHITSVSSTPPTQPSLNIIPEVDPNQQGSSNEDITIIGCLSSGLGTYSSISINTGQDVFSISLDVFYANPIVDYNSATGVSR